MRTDLSAFDSTIQTTHLWLKELMGLLGWQDQHRAYLAFRAVLHALRDRLSVDEAAALGGPIFWGQCGPPLSQGQCRPPGTGSPRQHRRGREGEEHLAGRDSRVVAR
jgi:hypothetical protein